MFQLHQLHQLHVLPTYLPYSLCLLEHNLPALHDNFPFPTPLLFFFSFYEAFYEAFYVKENHHKRQPLLHQLPLSKHPFSI